MGKSKKLASHELARYAPRSQTDFWAIVFFTLVSVGIAALIVITSLGSRIDALLYGTDYNGHVCASTISTPLNISNKEWKNRHALWYPFQFNSTTTQLYSGAVNTAICVEKCPSIGDTESTYGGLIDPIIQFEVQFNSTKHFQRCVPDADTFDCGDSAACESQKQLMKSFMSTVVRADGFVFGLLRDVREGWFVFVTIFFLTVILSFCWLYFMRFIVKPAMGCMIVLFFASTVVFGGFAVYRYSTTSTAIRYAWLSGGILAFLVSFVFTCMIIYLRKDIILGCAIIEEASKVVTEVPSMLFVPVVGSFFHALLCALFVYTTLLLYAHKGTSETTMSWAEKVFRVVEVGGADNWTIAGHLYNIFFFLWSTAFVHANETLILAMTVAQWYWSEPGSLKLPPSDAVRWSISTTTQKHLGTVALGSLLIAIIRFLRWLFRAIEKRLRACMSEGTSCFLLCCCNCCFSCFETLVQFLTENAYVVTAMTGESLFPAARHAASLLLRSAIILSVGILSDVFIAAAKGILTLGMTLLGFVWLYNTRGYSQESFVAAFLLLSIMTYCVVSLFAGVLLTSIETVLICFCYDRSVNNGADRPYYVPERLEEHLNTSYNRSRQLSSTIYVTEEDYLIQNGGRDRYA